MPYVGSFVVRFLLAGGRGLRLSLHSSSFLLQYSRIILRCLAWWYWWSWLSVLSGTPSFQRLQGSVSPNFRHFLCAFGWCLTERCLVSRTEVAPEENAEEVPPRAEHSRQAAPVAHLENGKWILWVCAGALSLCEATDFWHCRWRVPGEGAPLPVWEDQTKVNLGGAGDEKL